MNETPNEIKEKRLRLGITTKELSDAAGMPQGGEKMIRAWENGKSEPSQEELKRILNFPEKTPFPNKEKADYTMIDLFAGIGGTRLGFYQTGRVKCLFGSEIEKKGLSHLIPEELNISHKEEIIAIHKSYEEAGSDFITTNTFGLNRIKYKGIINKWKLYK